MENIHEDEIQIICPKIPYYKTVLKLVLHHVETLGVTKM